MLLEEKHSEKREYIKQRIGKFNAPVLAIINLYFTYIGILSIKE